MLSKLPPGQPAQVVALADTLQAMTQQTTDPGELRGAVSAIKESDARASFGELARYLRTLSESTKTPLDVHLISDLQKSAMPPGFTDVRLDQDTDITFHSIGKVQPNWAVETVIAPQHMYDPKQVRISATVTGFSAPAATRTVTLLMNGKTIQSKSVNVPENGRGSAEFAGLDAASYGFNRCEIRIDSADSLPADDRYAFSVERTDPKKVLFVDDGRRPQGAAVFPRGLERDAGLGVPIGSAPAGGRGHRGSVQVRSGGVERSGLVAVRSGTVAAEVRDGRRLAVRIHRAGIGGASARAGSG